MTLKELREQVLEANLNLAAYNLVTLTWGNASGILREEGKIVIKPSGLAYEKMKLKDMVVLDLEGRVVDGELRPSSDAPTHLELYRAFPSIGGIAHSHSGCATAFAQARREIPCLGTTHADAFAGPIPVTKLLRKKEVGESYEMHTGRVIVERFQKLNPEKIPGVLVAGHGPFTWGSDAMEAVQYSLILERIAALAIDSLQLNSKLRPLPEYIVEKHHQRKHGPNAYYGQPVERQK